MKSGKLQMDGKLFRVLVIVLAVIMMVLAFNLIFNIRDYSSWQANDETSFLYRIQYQEFNRMSYMVDNNRMHHVKETDGLKECYAISDYYTAAVYERAYAICGNPEQERKYEARMEKALSEMCTISQTAELIDGMFDDYFKQ